MTNKINGINVSECPLYDEQTGCYHTFNGKCVKDSCAVYKWLLEYKRLQQELDIKEKMFDKFMIGSGEVLEKLQKENEELKKENEKLKEKNKELLNLCNNGGALLFAESTKNKKYKQALEEIRELAEVNSLNTCWTILNNCDDCHNNNECGEQSPIAKLKFIKDKVNEVLNEQNIHY